MEILVYFYLDEYLCCNVLGVVSLYKCFRIYKGGWNWVVDIEKKVIKILGKVVDVLKSRID